MKYTILFAALFSATVNAWEDPPPTSPWEHIKGWVSQSPNRALYIHYNGGYATVDDTPVVGGIVVDTYVPENPIDHHAAVAGVIHSDDICTSQDENGRCWDHTAISGIAVNRGTSGTWGGHFQCKQINQEGTCLGVEINVESSGPESKYPWRPNNLPLDVIGRGMEGASNPQVGTLVRLRSSEDLPNADPAEVLRGLSIHGDIRYPVYIWTEHETAVVMQAGQKVCLDGTVCNHYIRYNSKTGKTEVK